MAGPTGRLIAKVSRELLDPLAGGGSGEGRGMVSEEVDTR